MIAVHAIPFPNGVCYLADLNRSVLPPLHKPQCLATFSSYAQMSEMGYTLGCRKLCSLDAQLSPLEEAILVAQVSGT